MKNFWCIPGLHLDVSELKAADQEREIQFRGVEKESEEHKKKLEDHEKKLEEHEKKLEEQDSKVSNLY